jgi:tetratricopeptide (TPR) repeat protein
METFDTLCQRLEELEHFDPLVVLEHSEAEATLESLFALAPDEQRARIAETDDGRGWGLARALLAASRACWLDDAETARQRADLAVMVANGIDPMRYHPQWTADLRAKAYAYLGNCHRISGDFAEADRAFQVSEHHLRHGVGSGRNRAEVLSLEASLRIDQHRSVEAQDCLETALDYYRMAGDRRGIGRIHLKRAIVDGHLGEWERAAEECCSALCEFDPVRDRALYVLALQNSVEYLLHLGAVAEARRRFNQLPPPLNRSGELRRLWIEGNLLRAEDDQSAARAAYDAARQGFAEERNSHYLGLVTLDQAALALDRGEYRQAFDEAKEAGLLFTYAAAAHEGLAAFIVRHHASVAIAAGRTVARAG